MLALASITVAPAGGLAFLPTAVIKPFSKTTVATGKTAPSTVCTVPPTMAIGFVCGPPGI